MIGRVVPQHELDENVYGPGEEHDSNALEVLIGRVRKKLGIELQGRGRIRNLVQVIFKSADLYERIRTGKGRHYNFVDVAGSTIVAQGCRTEFTLHSSLPPETDFRPVIADLIRLGNVVVAQPDERVERRRCAQDNAMRDVQPDVAHADARQMLDAGTDAVAVDPRVGRHAQQPG